MSQVSTAGRWRQALSEASRQTLTARWRGTLEALEAARREYRALHGAPAIDVRRIGTIQRGDTLIHTEHAGHKALCEENVSAHRIRWPIREEIDKAVDMADTVRWWRRQSRWRAARVLKA